jgi:hypothetical protein
MGRILEARDHERAAHRVACPRVPVAKWMGLIPAYWLEALEQNQQLPHCCRHPENHKIEAWYSSEEDRRKGIPDIYIFICEERHELAPALPIIVDGEVQGYSTPEYGEAWHRRFMVGGGKRPFWESR